MSVQMLYAVGSNSNGQLGVNSTEESSVLFAHVKNGMLAGGNTISLLHSWGFYSTFMIEAPSKSQIICGAGDNEFSLLSTEKHIPTLPEFEPIDMQGVVSSKRPLVKFLACGTHHSVLCTTDNRIYAKGYNETGNLGIAKNSIIERKWVQVAMPRSGRVDKLVCGSYHTVVQMGKNLLGFGSNSFGQLSLGLQRQQMSPVDLAVSISKVFCGFYCTFCLSEDGKRLYATGRNYYQQLGVGRAEERLLNFTLVKLKFKELSTVAASYFNTFFLVDKQLVYMCGLPTEYLVSQRQIVSIPILVTLTICGRVIHLTCSYDSVALLTDKNELLVQGANEYGELGTGNGLPVRSWTFVPVQNIEPFGIVKQVEFGNISMYLLLEVRKPIFSTAQISSIGKLLGYYDTSVITTL